MHFNDNKQTIAAMYNALAQGDSGVFAKACHRDYVWRFPGHYRWAWRFEGQDAIQRQLILPQAGLRYNNECCFVFKFKNSKIIEVVEYCDTDLMERVLGKYEDAVSSYYNTSLQNEPSKI